MLGIQPSYAGLAGVQPSHMGRVGHSKKNIQRNYLNICDFPPIFTAF